MKTTNALFRETRNTLKALNLPVTDYSFSSEEMKEFEGGGHYGIELSSMNNIKIASRALALSKDYQFKVARLIECRGIVRLPDDEIQEMVDLCSTEGVGLVLSVGPRAISDIGAFAASKNGKRMGYRLRGMENIVHAVEDIKRALSFGVTGFLIYDEGLLYLLNKMRLKGYLPKDIMLKYSVHAGCANPVSAKLLEEQGADTINIIPDLDNHMIQTFRQAISVPIDVFSDTAKAAGGLLRTYDMPEVIRTAAPVYLKCGPISQPEQNHLPTAVELEERVKQAKNVVEHIERFLPEAQLVGRSEKTLALPNKDILSQCRSADLLKNVVDLVETKVA